MRKIAGFTALCIISLFAIVIAGRSGRGGSLSAPALSPVSVEDPLPKETMERLEIERVEVMDDENGEPLLIREATFFPASNARTRLSLRALGVEFLMATGRNRAMVRIPASRSAAVRAHPAVRSLSVRTAEVGGLRDLPFDKMTTVALQAYRGVDLDMVRRGIRNPKIRVLSSFPKLHAMIVKGKKADLLALARLPGVYHISSIPEIALTNADCAALSNVDLAQEGSSVTGPLSGSGISAGIWDGGKVYANHQDLFGRVENKSDGSGWSNHATHVSGTILGSGKGNADAAGMAPGATLKAWSIYKAGPTFMDVINQWIEKEDAYHVANNSWGANTGWRSWFWFGDPEPGKEDANFGRYTNASHMIDGATATDDRIIVLSAGNDRNDVWFGGHLHAVESGYFTCSHPKDGRDDDDPEGAMDGTDTLGPTAVAKNPIMVGAVTKAGAMSYFSSWGPADDGRIKPDIVAGGAGVVSTMPYDSYMSMSGPSMSAPVVTGSIVLLLEQMNTQGYSFGKKPPLSLVKALLIHTAQDLGEPGPDYKTGWGLLDAKAAVDHIDADVQAGKLSRMKLGKLKDGEVFTASFYAEQGDPVRLTLAWSDLPGPIVSDLPADDPGEGALMNDLDIELEGPDGKGKTGAWLLDPSDPLAAATKADPASGESNSVDNVEQVRLDSAPVSGMYKIRISHKGVLSGLDPEKAEQAFSLVASHDLVDSGVETEVVPGDLTGDGAVNVVDLQMMFLVIHGKVDLTPDLLAVADLVQDGKVNVVDLIALIKLIHKS